MSSNALSVSALEQVSFDTEVKNTHLIHYFRVQQHPFIALHYSRGLTSLLPRP